MIQRKVILRTGDSSDIHAYVQVWVNEEYKAAMAPLKKMESRRIENDKPMVIVDAGANIGLTSLYFRSHFPYSVTLSIEPDEANCDQIDELIKLNNIRSELWLVERMALHNKVGYANLSNNYRDKREWSIQAIPTPLKSDRSVRMISIPYLLWQNNWDEIHLLKIDIEGGEQYLFADDASAHDTLSRTRTVAVEIHDDAIPPGTRERIYKYLAKYKFIITEVGETTFGVKQ